MRQAIFNKKFQIGKEVCQMSNTRVVTEEVRFSYVNLLKPRESRFGGDPKYSTTILIPKSDIATKQAIDNAIAAAIELGRQKKWNGVVPPVVPTPIHDGDGVKQDGTPFGDECKGHWVLTASSSVDQPPRIVDANLNPIMDATEIYSGMYGRIALNFAPYNSHGKKGIGCYISTNVQKTRDGEPLGATAPDASSDFGGPVNNVTNQLPTGMTNQPPQPYAQQPPMQQQYGQAPQYQQPLVQQTPIQQPMQQPYTQQPQQPTQVDPVTGAPIQNGNGGIMGI